MREIVSSDLLAWKRVEGGIEYPPLTAAPYAPSEAFPEFPDLDVGTSPNPIFSAVRDVLQDMGLDAEHVGTAQWNPLGDLVQPGGKIVVKPNWVTHRNEGPGGMDCMITHPSVLRAVLEYVFLARPAQVVLGDAPLQGCDFERLLDFGGLRSVITDAQSRGQPLIVKDFRRTVLREDGDLKQVAEELRPESDYRLVDLATDSLLEPISKDWKKFRVTVYDPRKMWAHHRPGRHRYLIAREVLEADLVVNCPKLKTHKKAGITCCLKNLIGINGNKEYLPHHRKGAADTGAGDNYAHAHWKMSAAENLLDYANGHLLAWPHLYRLFERVAWRLMVQHAKVDRTAQIEGSWHGNDTVWRTCLDLNRALLYADAAGQMCDLPQRQELSIVDAVVAGQGDGPLRPDPLAAGILFAAHNPACGDLFAAHLYHFGPDQFPLLSHLADSMRWPIYAGNAPISEEVSDLHAIPPEHWRGTIEQPSDRAGA